VTEKNENIHAFVIKDDYARKRVKQNFSTNATAFEAIFGVEFKIIPS
jgi:hypothetical protein